jgi:hypothetical protein
MNLFQSGLSTLSEQQERPESQKPSQPQQGDDATVKAASAISQAVLHRQLTSDEKRVAGPMVHYAFGSVVGGLYGAMAEVVPVTAKAWAFRSARLCGWAPMRSASPPLVCRNLQTRSPSRRTLPH